jgi:hypothetical protein
MYGRAGDGMTTPTIALDKIMTHPRYPEIVKLARAHAPVGVLDQADAATAETLTIAEQIGQHIGAERTTILEPTQVADWLRLSALAAFVAWVKGEASTCRHSPDPRHPQPVLAAAWRPDLVVCRNCAHLLALPPGSNQDKTCDCCGHQCTGDGDDLIRPSAIQLGPLVLLHATCADCDPPTVAAPATEGVRAAADPSSRRREKAGRPRGRGRR